MVFTCSKDTHGWNSLKVGVFDGCPVSTWGQKDLLLIAHICCLRRPLGFAALLKVQAVFLGGLG